MHMFMHMSARMSIHMLCLHMCPYTRCNKINKLEAQLATLIVHRHKCNTCIHMCMCMCVDMVVGVY